MVHPHDGEVFLAPANIALVASAWDLDGTIAKVEFFDGATLDRILAGSAGRVLPLDRVAEIAGQRTMITYRPSLTVKNMVFRTEGIKLKNVQMAPLKN